MRRFGSAVAFLVIAALSGKATLAESTRINLGTTAGAKAVKGEWRYSDVKIVEVPGTGPDGKPNRTNNIEPRAHDTKFDDSKWEVIPADSLGKPRAGGQVCFNWYRIKITIPEDAAGKSVFFQAIVDDYGEVWVDGKLPYKGGQTGGPIVAGFNTPNRVELKDATPGKVFQIAVFGINGPISVAPPNRIFLRDVFLDLVDKP
jgi:gluconolactonase